MTADNNALPNQEFLQWIYDRMVNVHGENPNFDYMIKFLSLIKWQPMDTIPFDTPILVTDNKIIVSVKIIKYNHGCVVNCFGVMGFDSECELSFDELTGWKHL